MSVARIRDLRKVGGRKAGGMLMRLMAPALAVLLSTTLFTPAHAALQPEPVSVQAAAKPDLLAHVTAKNTRIREGEWIALTGYLHNWDYATARNVRMTVELPAIYFGSVRVTNTYGAATCTVRTDETDINTRTTVTCTFPVAVPESRQLIEISAIAKARNITTSITATADPNKVIAESNEFNNAETLTVSLIPPFPIKNTDPVAPPGSVIGR